MLRCRGTTKQSFVAAMAGGDSGNALLALSAPPGLLPSSHMNREFIGQLRYLVTL